MSYSSEQYQQEKATGHRLPSGALPLLSLSPFHIEIVKAHLDGVRNKDLADIFHLTESTISRILSDPLVIAIKSEHASATDAQFDALYSQAVNAIRRGLDADDPDLALKASSMFFKHAPSKAGGAPAGISAEDVARQLLLSVNVTINNGGSNALNALAPTGTTFDATSDLGSSVLSDQSISLSRGTGSAGEECDDPPSAEFFPARKTG